MTENKGIMLAKSVQKHAGRAKEKILQNLGKVDRTADEIFDDHLNNFNRQQTSANRLQKEFNNYIRCIRAAQTASKSLMEAICEIYEPQWIGYDALQAQTGASESLWQDFAHKLGDQVLIPLNTYTGQFPEMKKKVEKRNRKLIDYDGQRHSFQSLQANANKRKDEVKIIKGREQLEEARRTYEILNTELHDELPALYDSRILFLVTNLQTLFATEQVFHNETAKIYSELEAIVDKLATESQRGPNTLRKQTSNAIKTPTSPGQTPIKQLNNANLNNSNNYQNQITTNGGGSLANSPTSTSSSSHQEPRFDSLSSTPETTPENQKLGNTSVTATTTTASSSPAKELNEPEYENAIEVAAGSAAVNQAKKQIADNDDIANKLTNVFSETATSTSTSSSPATEATLSLSAAAASASAATTTSTTTTATTEVSAVPVKPATGSQTSKPIPKPEAQQQQQQLNGNNNNNDQTDESGKAPTNNGNNIIDPESTDQKQLGNDHIENAQKINIKPKPNRLNQKAKLLEAVNSSNQLVVNHKNYSKNKNPFEDDDSDERIYEMPKDATTADLPPGVLYRVKATYGYVKEDVDELSFEIGDIIRVIEYDDPEDQEEGWLMGQKEGTNEKGLFPANFTRPI